MSRAAQGTGGKGRPRPRALLLVDPAELPEGCVPEVARHVDPTWWPDGLAAVPASDARLAAWEVLVTGPQELTRASLLRLPRLRLILATTTATDYIDVDYCRQAGIEVRNCAAYGGTSVAEHAFALLLSCVRQLPRALRLAGDEAAVPDYRRSFELSGRTAGVIGLGDIGRRVARLAVGFDMHVVFTTPRAVQVPGATQVGLDDLLGMSDVVFVTAPLNATTRGLFDARALSLMRPTSYIVSISPEEILDLCALEDALRSDALAGAAIDVVGRTEHMQDVPRLLVTHRWGIRTQDARVRRAKKWISELAEGVSTGLPRDLEP